MPNRPVVPGAGLNELHQHILNGAVADPRHAYLSRYVPHRRLRFGIHRFASISDAHGARGAIDIHPVGAVVRIKVLASILVETAAAAHGEGGLPAGSGAMLKEARRRVTA